MSKIIRVFIVAFTIMVFFIISVFSASQMNVHSEKSVYEVKNNSEISIPIILENNSGLMGFRISVDYPSDVLYLPSTERGSLLNNGNYIDSIDVSTNGQFDILWNSASNVIDDGELFVLNFKVYSKAEIGNYVIKLTFNQDDTFNEDWDDVALNLQDITLCVKAPGLGDEIKENLSNTNESTNSNNTELLTTSVLSGESASFGTHNNLTSNSETKSNNIPSKVETLSDSLVSELTEKEIILKETVEQAKKEMGISINEEVPEKMKQEFAEKVSSIISEKIKEDKVMAYEEIEKEYKLITEKTDKENRIKPNANLIISIIILLLIVLALSLCLIYVKNRKTSNV